MGARMVPAIANMNRPRGRMGGGGDDDDLRKFLTVMLVAALVGVVACLFMAVLAIGESRDYVQPPMIHEGTEIYGWSCYYKTHLCSGHTLDGTPVRWRESDMQDGSWATATPTPAPTLATTQTPMPPTETVFP